MRMAEREVVASPNRINRLRWQPAPRAFIEANSELGALANRICMLEPDRAVLTADVAAETCTTPSATALARFHGRLTAAAAQPAREAVRTAIVAAAELVHSVPEWRHLELPYLDLANALLALDSGRTLPILQKRQTPNPSGDHSSESVRAYAAALVDALKDRGEGRLDDIARRVAKAVPASLKADKETVLLWRKQFQARNPLAQKRLGSQRYHQIGPKLRQAANGVPTATLLAAFTSTAAKMLAASSDVR
jgi:hypothetical protein